MTTTATEKTIERIRRLLAVAEHPNTSPEEAKVHRERAMALMAKYNVERAHLAAAGQTPDELGTSVLIVDVKTYQLEHLYLIGSIVDAKTCRAVQWKVNGITYVLVVGHTSDLDAVTMLYASLSLQMSNEVNTILPAGRGRAPARKAFMRGFASRVGEKLREANQQAAAEADASNGGPSTELVLRDRATAVEQYFKTKAPNTGTVKARPVKDYGAFLAGRDAGDRADVGGRARLGGDRRAINA
ncbi:uncharacterized protein DUF2786 [Nonomuraea fuscirosea]|uniref:Uncharacterized protein DUF2786 n=1 Tax=Nonomuraea fuscirosea TaxID=1291556 RepID=A0A2T0N2G6_9ACTN|nr:DUF2786 domain-containing protein [Nonomuraea fuscirosea]PRX66173.1 uncharacterized protein DUF2786 [Nonomuraea fuscirosea]